MHHVNLIIAKDPAEVGKLAADIFQDIISAKGDCVLGLATGSTPLPLYRELIEREKAGKIDFSRVRSANLDEYKGLSGEHPQSYRYFMQQNLFDHISIDSANTMVPDGLTDDAQAMCTEYERKIDELGGIEYENFNAAAARVLFHGKSVHPGSAKNKMVNAALLVMEFDSMLPPCETPAHTAGKEGFYHLVTSCGDVSSARLSYILREHDAGLLKKQEETLLRVARYMNEKYGTERVTVQIKERYRNMAEVIEQYPFLIEMAKED